MPEVLVDFRDRVSPVEKTLDVKRLRYRGLATRMGVSCTLRFERSGTSGAHIVDDGFGLIISPPAGEWWYLRSFRAYVEDSGTAPNSTFEFILFRHSPEYKALGGDVFPGQAGDVWFDAEAGDGLKPYSPPTVTPDPWIQISEAKLGVVEARKDWRSSDEIFERHVYNEEVLLFHTRVDTIPAGSLFPYPHLLLHVIRYPMPDNVREWVRREYPKITRADLQGLFLEATPDAEKD